jgi:serine/threonine protein kinase/tetratricopeptide (TPR) repeat protein
MWRDVWATLVIDWISAMPKTPLAVDPASATDPPFEPAPRTRTEPTAVPRAATRIAQGGVVPPAARPRRAAVDETQAANVATLPTTPAGDRSSRVGTRLHGTDGLAEPSAEAPKLRLTAGRVVPGTRYRILRWLGEGGMGVVYEAEHTDIERKVALKILRFDLSRQPRMVQVFRDEARAASRLGSPHIVEIFDFGELPDGRSFFAMELLAGRDLVPLDGQVVEPGRLIGMMRQVCKGLHVAHRAQVVHRDVKPENIIAVTENGRPDAIKIVDFGISAMLAAGTNDGTIAGTPHYMAPEQITGTEFDGRLDIYALGCTAYELLTGAPPFDADNVEDLLQMQLNATPDPLHVRRSELASTPALCKVIMRCLGKLPEERYADMADLEAALCEAQIADRLTTPWDDLPLPELPDVARRERLLRDMPSPGAIGPVRNRWLWPVVAGTSTLAAVALGLFLAFGKPPEPAPVVDDAVETLATEARDAAARLNWVMPPPRERDAATAYRRVLDLEALEGSSAEVADARAAELRKEFATTLSGQADRLWEQHAELAAANHYLWSLVFDPSNQVALERSGVDSAILADFVRRAKAMSFTDSELNLGYIATLQSDETTEGEARRNEELDAAIAALSPQAAVIVGESLEVEGSPTRRRPQVAAASAPTVAPAVATPVPTVAPAAASPTDVEITDDAIDAKGTKRRRNLGTDAKVVLGGTQRDPEQAKALAEQGTAALRAGRRSDASSLFNQALAFDHSNAVALMGLSDIAFDTGADAKAVKYAEKAVEASPSNQGYRLKLGDAYFKVLRYREALEQYEDAKRRGSSKADERIAKVKAKLGG